VAIFKGGLAGLPREQLQRYLLLNIYGAPLSALWAAFNTLIAAHVVEQLVSEGQKNTFLGVLLGFGLGIAALTQPFAGAVSDRYGSRFGRRKPFILGSALLDGVFICAFGLATNFWLAFVAYAFLQLAANFGQAAYQALVPDFAREEERGVASGAKAALEVVGRVIGLGVAGLFIWLDMDWGAYAAIILLLLSGALITFRHLREPPVAGQPLLRGIFSTGLKAYTFDVRANPRFARLVATRFVFFAGIGSISGFLRNFMSDVLGLEEPEVWAAGVLVVATVVGVVGALAAGTIVDRLGRRRVAIAAALIAAVYLLPLAFFPRLYLMLVLGGVLGLAGGAFTVSTWAFLADEIPKGESARFYGIANYAMAGAGALGMVIFGPMIDGLNAWKEVAGFRALIVIAAILLVACLPLLPQERWRAARRPAPGADG